MGGFSMGAHQAMHAVYRNRISVNKCFNMSTYLIRTSSVFSAVEHRIQAGETLPPLHISHGTQDDITPLSWAEDAYKTFHNSGLECYLETWNHKHDMSKEQLDSLFKWLRTA
eukprot:TRINITY_DN11465_c0_g1_i3.p1 TRINITY_DN11465_c0_g1~~TRINITY_DN11465_c0_g1_i3.p1  ORF type:complete len:112 (+),score=8.95 TRINITY_DN11465_c0_g1_i3:123-458(+)